MIASGSAFESLTQVARAPPSSPHCCPRLTRPVSSSCRAGRSGEEHHASQHVLLRAARVSASAEADAGRWWLGQGRPSAAPCALDVLVHIAALRSLLFLFLLLFARSISFILGQAIAHQR